MLDVVVLETLRYWMAKKYRIAEINGPAVTPGDDGLVITPAFGQDVNARPLITVNQGSAKNAETPWIGWVADASLAPLTYRHETVTVEIETDETQGLLGLHQLMDDVFEIFASARDLWTFPPPQGCGIYFPMWGSGEDELFSLNESGGHQIYKNRIEVSGSYEVAGIPSGLTTAAAIVLSVEEDGTTLLTDTFSFGGT